MAGRLLTAGMVTALEASTIRPVLIGRLDIVTDPVLAWTGPGQLTVGVAETGDGALDNNVFLNAAPFIQMSDIAEDQGIGGPTSLTITGHDLDEDLLQQVVKDKRAWRGKPAYLWMGLMNADEATVVTYPMRIKTGVMTQMTVHRTNDQASVTVTIDKDLGRARGAAFRWLDHVRIFPNDTWSTFIMDLANNPEGFTNAPLGRGGSSSGSFFGGGGLWGPGFQAPDPYVYRGPVGPPR